MKMKIEIKEIDGRAAEIIRKALKTYLREEHITESRLERSIQLHENDEKTDDRLWWQEHKKMRADLAIRNIKDIETILQVLDAAVGAEGKEEQDEQEH